jgi:hypothetical protein
VFVAFSKVLDWLAAPLSWALLLLLAAALFRRRARLARALAALGAATLVLFSSGPVASGLERLAERGARSTYRPDVVYDAIVVLGGWWTTPPLARAARPSSTRGRIACSAPTSSCAPDGPAPSSSPRG